LVTPVPALMRCTSPGTKGAPSETKREPGWVCRRVQTDCGGEYRR
jgi:hypothetical protein